MTQLGLLDGMDEAKPEPPTFRHMRRRARIRVKAKRRLRAHGVPVEVMATDEELVRLLRELRARLKSERLYEGTP